MSSGNGHTTMKDVARLAGVSPATVSLALGNDPRVNIKTRKLVREAADKLRYIPNEIGRSLRSQKTETIALVIPHTSQHVFSHPYFAKLLEGITEVLNENGYNLLLSTTAEENDEQSAYEKVLRNRRADGVIVSSASLFDRNFLRLVDSGFPVVYLGPWTNNDIYTVERDDVMGAFSATDHLLKLGRRKIVHFTGPLNHQVGRDRLEGYRLAHQQNQVPVNEELVIEKDLSVNAGYEGVTELLDRQIPFDALFAGNDLMAIGAMKQLLERGIKVPEQISVVGFDDIDMASMFHPTLTTVHQPMKQTGILAAQKLLGVLNGREDIEKKTVLQTKLMIRESCGG
ncbi:LacI family DNA-binding transcriptional regulator [Cohnella nanjingensis]|uniref:LacI family DNA-binding transcriptional regulator n=1 Tax=Cohnella nanjingensis TaxID=1387779 RepID=A0A7X0RQL9_9BACL|nr:LacI family DNA-binding transcriptional regulator [Cohnella nanjingensis]MBB6671852.1 LacI family DNA-binding transcriptional regulator [Cohnella nanjingensis]